MPGIYVDTYTGTWGESAGLVFLDGTAEEVAALEALDSDSEIIAYAKSRPEYTEDTNWDRSGH